MRKFVFILLQSLVTTVVFSMRVDRPPDNDIVTMEISQDVAVCNDVVYMVTLQVVPEYCYKEITQSLENEANEIKATEIRTTIPKEKYLKKSGTEVYTLNNGFDNTLTSENKSKTHLIINVKHNRFSHPVISYRIRSPSDSNIQA